MDSSLDKKSYFLQSFLKKKNNRSDYSQVWMNRILAQSRAAHEETVTIQAERQEDIPKSEHLTYLINSSPRWTNFINPHSAWAVSV